VVIGAGVVGAYTAYRLASLGHRVIILERKEPGLEASGLNAGSLAVQNKPLPLVRLALKGTETWEAFEAETGLTTHYHRTGGLRVAHDEAGVQRLRAAAADHQALGLAIEHIDGDTARGRCPALGPAVLAANWSPYDGHNDALTATQALMNAAQHAGATLFDRCQVTRIRVEDRGVVVESSRGAVRAERVAITAGLWSRELCADLGVDVPLRVRNNQLMVTAPQPTLLELLITHASGRLTLKQVSAGSVLIGGGWPGDGDFARNTKRPNLASMIGNAELAIRIVPSLANAPVIRSWAGFDGRTPDELPFVGPLQATPNVWVCTSCYGTYTLGPALAEGLATWMHSGEQPELLQGFAPSQRVVGNEPTYVRSA
jgi:sarcosine oxidase, subunit beta